MFLYSKTFVICSFKTELRSFNHTHKIKKALQEKNKNNIVHTSWDGPKWPEWDLYRNENTCLDTITHTVVGSSRSSLGARRFIIWLVCFPSPLSFSNNNNIAWVWKRRWISGWKFWFANFYGEDPLEWSELNVQ